MISGKANVKALNVMLQTEIHQYKDAIRKGLFLAVAASRFSRKDLPIQAIHGLNNVTQRRHYAKQLGRQEAVN